ncbi:putative quinol monooxygenase [Thioclava sp. 15-R06ZXC-3]|uniref:Quinol monooxygenase n=1 Tax=Thioclava arctica TaxID=3238301 RepID=A0ABV3TJC1_9RHOB
MFVITVTFTIHPGQMGRFIPLMRAQAQQSLDLEEGCLRFDVCTEAKSDPTRVFLYEVYSNAAAFEQHLASTHFQQFDSAVAELVQAKEVQSWELSPCGQASVSVL